jgi:cellulose synthase/poly-beta-1,6-N-acetylglucosamine synthase-like glycosyltransferase
MGWPIVTVTLAFFALVPIAAMALAWGGFAYRCKNRDRPPQPLPEVAVVLSLRGADQTLEACLEGLLAQDYPDYRLHIVIDSAEDPAQAVVARILAAAGPRAARVRVETRKLLSESCSPKLSAQRQVLTRLDKKVGVVAFIDADCHPSPNWLREMVASRSPTRGWARRPAFAGRPRSTPGAVRSPATPSLQ